MVIAGALTLGVAAFVTLVAVGVHWLVRPYTNRKDHPENNDVIGFVLTVAGTIYAVVLAFVVVAVWQNFDRAENTAQREVSAVADLYHAAADLPQPVRNQERQLLLDYTHLMIVNEWPEMQRGHHSVGAQKTLDRIRTALTTFVPKNAAAGNAREAMTSLVERFADARRERLAEAGHGIPGVLWLALAIGAAVTMAFVYLFVLEHAPTHLAMTALLAIVIGVMFALIAQLNYPFRGPSAVPVSGWERLAVTMPKGE